jgi:hypothetical protein
MPRPANNFKRPHCLGYAQEQVLNAGPGDDETGDAVAGEHHAQAPRVEVELVRVCPTRERMVDDHHPRLQPGSSW